MIQEKVIIISYFNCFQSDKEFLPFIKNETKTLKSTEKTFSWNNAYQNLKHDRSNSLEYGSIKYLFDIMGALFILNLYYKSEVYDLKNDASATNLPVSMGSDLFSIKIHISSSHTVQDNKLEYLKKPDFDQCIYFTKLKDDSVKIEEDAIKRTNEENMKLLVQYPKFIEYVKHNDISKYTGHNIMWDILGKDDYIKLVRETISIITEANRSLSYEAVVNKNNI